MTEEEREQVKRTLLDLIEEVKGASGFSGTLVDKLNAVSAATCALVCLDGGVIGVDAASVAASIASRARQTMRGVKG